MELHRTLPTSSEVIGSMEDLLIQILIRLPVKSLMRFKLVSKNWKSLITSPCFSLQYNPGRNPAIGLFYPDWESSSFGYIHLNFQNTTGPPFRELKFPEDPYPVLIHHSCNGLLLCCSDVIFCFDCSDEISAIGKCFIYNPTTNCFTKLPRPGVVNGIPKSVRGMNLAFDPTKSAFHKVVCVRESELAPDLRQIEIYSSESDEWRASGEPFKSHAIIHNGVYWNGSIHWISYADFEVLFFNVDEERHGKIPIPIEPYDGHRLQKFSYLGESCDHLHLVLNYDIGADVIVYEMKRDRSEWFVKYRVDLTAVVRASFPGRAYFNYLMGRGYDKFNILSLVRSKKESAFLVLVVSRKVFLFNLECNTFEEVYMFGDAGIGYPYRAYEYVESLHMFRGPA
ncbi:hypothetical protein BUALT_Bualt06G0135000 [Buddleja alternifolia]|uniref:F-box domain-containing protein n=1 Tax=Buddleja alternifolia TaxID=168488 RepID=A0AAV6XLR9_9LAMI|nr:hypothetical protein BUALT_Bualt06G0135000 [Buddleja alternifolia]